MLDELSFVKGINIGCIISAFVLGMISLMTLPIMIITWWAFLIPLFVMFIIDMRCVMCE